MEHRYRLQPGSNGLIVIVIGVAGSGRQRRSGVISCSVLKQRYRDFLSKDIADPRFIHLDGDPAVIRARMQAREDKHFMPAELPDSQLAALEPPTSALSVPVGLTTDQQVAVVLDAMQLEAGL